jgi:hypothetical protein
MSVQLLQVATEFRRNDEKVPFQELVNSTSLLLEVARDFSQRGTPISHLERGPDRTSQHQWPLDISE